MVHTIGFFVKPEPVNDTERQLFDLVQNYRLDLGVGFHRAMGDLMTGLSMCFTLLFLFGCLMSFYLLHKRVAADVMKGVININLIIFGFCFAWMVVFTFLPPIILSGLVFAFLVAARLAVFNKSAE